MFVYFSLRQYCLRHKDLLLPDVLHRVLVASHPALHCHGSQADKHNYYSCRHNPRPPYYAVAVLLNPFRHEMNYYRHCNYEGDAHVEHERAYQSYANLVAGRAEHLAHGNLSCALLYEVGRHGHKSEQRDYDGYEGEERHDFGCAQLLLEACLHILVYERRT